MPVVRRIPDNKRRSRTGCIPCRRRRRKCDEQRPQCGSCIGRNVTCEFKEWTFVPGVRSSLRKDGSVQGDNGDDADSSLPIQDSLLSFVESSPAPAEPVFESPVASTARIERLESIHNTTTDVPQPIPSNNNHHQHDGNQIPTPSRWNETVLSEQNSSERQTAMLRFRYQIVPWLDSNAPRSTFGPKIMTLATEKSTIMDIIIWVAMRRSRKTSNSASHESDSHLVQQFQHRLSLEDAFIADVGRSLLALGNFFYTGPSEWANLHSDCVDVRERCQFFESQEEPLKTLDRFHFKTELAASIITTKSPSLQSLPLMNDTFLTSALTPPSIYDDCLTHLAACCHLIHDEIIPLFKRDLDHATSTNTPFTADVYSSAIAVQANLAIHFSALLLLSYKPRLVKLSSIPHRLASRSWHAQKLAKLALWNNFSDQWDPVVVATVVRIARDMTYPSQQEALLSCFQRIGDATKIPLQTEIADLQHFWSSSRHSSAPTNTHP
ncbi:hypothetical protein QL093DRAFT_2453587 [Fusarium oxysporum]|nr:hypothetical protein QL093DRAFT_2453587 [Fusarium oxysporum]